MKNLQNQFSGGKKMKTRALLFSASLLVGGFLVPLGSSSAQTDAGAPPAADNSAMNQRDAGHETLTPMDQSSKPTDVNMTREIRRAIVKDDQLSMDAKNIKIITVDGAVTLRGPVKTEQEKADIAAKAAQLAGDSNVHNDLEVAGQ
jgi:hyperosmotically inducible protein